MSISQNFPGEGPNLYLNPAGSKILDPRISFSRDSTGTYVDDDGFIKVAPINSPRFDHNPTTGESLGLLVEEQRTNYVLANDNIRLLDVNGTITSQSWKREVFGSSPYGDITLYPYSGLSPEGKYNATRMTITNQSAGGSCYLIKNQVHESGAILGATGTYTASIWIKSNTGSNQTVLAALAQYSGAASGTTSTSWTVTPTWQRFSFTYNIVTIGNIRVMFVGGSGNSGLDVLIWGASIEPGRYVTSHIPTTPTFTSRDSSATFYDSSGILQTAGTNVARSNAFLPDSSGVMRSVGLLLESSATNSLSSSIRTTDYAGNTSGSGWTLTANSGTAPDGTNTATKLTQTGDIGNFGVVWGSSWLSTSVIISVFVKPLSGNTQLSGQTGSGDQYSFYLNSYVYADESGGRHPVGTITRIGNGWLRISLNSFNASGQPLPGPYFSLNLRGTGEILFWGFQLETAPSNSYPTSYIATSGAAATRAADVSSSSAVTRSADVVTLSGTSNINNETGGTLVSLRGQTSSVINETSLTINPTSLSSYKPISEILYYPSVLTSSTIRQMRGNTSYVTNGLVLHLDAGNTTSYPGTGTTWTDLSGNGNTGTLTNGPTYSSANDGSIVFDGVNDYVENTSPNIGITGNASVTLSCWFYFTGTSIANSYVSLLSYGNGPVNLDTFALGINDVFRLTMSFNGGNNAVSNQNIITTNTWYNFVGTKTAGAINTTTKLYLNGNEVSIASASSLTPNVTSRVLRVGRWTNDGGGNEYYYTGRVSNCSIYNRALSASEVTQNFNALRGRYGI